MSRNNLLWETTHKARKSHFCDWCHQHIGRGEVYTRLAWKVRRGELLIIKQHETPSCEPATEEESVRDEEEIRRIVILEIKVMSVLKMQINGNTIVEHETLIVPTIVSEYSLEDPDEDVPF